jgi:hypothetical protein
MRHPLLAALVLGPAAALLMANAGVFSSTGAPVSASPTALPAKSCDSQCSPDWMDANLRLDQLQMIGTGASYKQRPEASVLAIIRMGGRADAEALDFGQPGLAAQLDADVRALSFDIVHDPKGGAFRHPAIANMAMTLLADDYVAAMKRPGFKVMHVPDVDYRSSCLALTDCLRQVFAWSRAHPRHLPILIILRPHDEKTRIPGAVTPPAIDAAALQALEREVQTVFSGDRVITPALVRGRHASLRQAVAVAGWSRLGALRGKVMFVLEGKAAGRYHGALLFTAGQADSAIAIVPDPVRDASRIAASRQSGLLVMTRADEETREARRYDTTRRDAAFASGAQIVLSDFAVTDPAIGPYRVSLSDNAQARCGAILGSEKCVRVLEPPRILTASLP